LLARPESDGCFKVADSCRMDQEAEKRLCRLGGGSG
jgi:hypothetical protein